jgi:hypothetical protein
MAAGFGIARRSIRATSEGQNWPFALPALRDLNFCIDLGALLQLMGKSRPILLTRAIRIKADFAEDSTAGDDEGDARRNHKAMTVRAERMAASAYIRSVGNVESHLCVCAICPKTTVFEQVSTRSWIEYCPPKAGVY